MNVDNEIYYHVHRKEYSSDKWYVGNVLTFNNEYYNFFFDYYVKFNLKRTDACIDTNLKDKEYCTLIRELIYEEVRYKYFSDLPSRRHCIWLCDKDSLSLWINTLGGQYDIYKVKATGNLHTCYAGALNDDNINYDILFNKAVSYWRGECIGNPLEKEFLFEGAIELLEIINDTTFAEKNN